MSNDTPMDTSEIASVCAVLALFAGYHLHLYIIRPCFLGRDIPFAINMTNAELWIKKHKEGGDPATVVLAVQTLRNTITSAIFIGGNAIVIAYNLANDYPSLGSDRLKVRSLIIMALMFTSFLCWANVIRLASVLGYMIGTMAYSEKLRADALALEKSRASPISDSDDNSIVSALSAEGASTGPSNASSANYSNGSSARKRKNKGKSKKSQQTKTLAKDHVFTADAIPDIYEEGASIVKFVTIFFSLGFRLMFVSIPFAFYTAGPIALLICAGTLLVFLILFDYVHHEGQSS